MVNEKWIKAWVKPRSKKRDYPKPNPNPREKRELLSLETNYKDKTKLIGN